MEPIIPIRNDKPQNPHNNCGDATGHDIVLKIWFQLSVPDSVSYASYCKI